MGGVSAGGAKRLKASWDSGLVEGAGDLRDLDLEVRRLRKLGMSSATG